MFCYVYDRCRSVEPGLFLLGPDDLLGRRSNNDARCSLLSPSVVRSLSDSVHVSPPSVTVSPSVIVSSSSISSLVSL